MTKELMIEIFFYLGYAVATLGVIALVILLFWVIVFNLLNIKRIRFVIFKIILRKSIETLNDNEFASLIAQMKRKRS